MSTSFRYSSPEETAEALKRVNSIRLLDVREPGEFESEYISGSLNMPFSSFEKSANALAPSDEIHLLCEVGARATSAAAFLRQKGFLNVAVVTGGINNWKRVGLPVNKGSRNIWGLERQVRFAAGLLVLLGIAVSFKNPWGLALSSFVGCGLVFSGITGLCGMAKILAWAPWNRK